MKLRLLFLVWFCLAAPFSWGGGGMVASEAKAKDAIQLVITEQLAAFRAGDFKAAYVFADQGLKDICTLEMFEKMVKTGYPEIARNVSGRCGLTFDNGSEATVNVRIFGKGEESIDYRYTLHFSGGAWRITGVVLLSELTTEV